jgi:hypothetical protein
MKKVEGKMNISDEGKDFGQLRRIFHGIISIFGIVALVAMLVVQNMYGNSISETLKRVAHIATTAFILGTAFQIAATSLDILFREGVGALEGRRWVLILVELALLIRLLTENAKEDKRSIGYFALRIALGSIIYKIHELGSLEASPGLLRFPFLEAIVLGTLVWLLLTKKIDLLGHGVCFAGIVAGLQSLLRSLAAEEEPLFALGNIRMLTCILCLFLAFVVISREPLFYVKSLADIKMSDNNFHIKRQSLIAFLNKLGPSLLVLVPFIGKFVALQGPVSA